MARDVDSTFKSLKTDKTLYAAHAGSFTAASFAIFNSVFAFCGFSFEFIADQNTNPNLISLPFCLLQRERCFAFFSILSINNSKFFFKTSSVLSLL